MKKLLIVALVVLGGVAAFAAEPNTWWVAKEDANASDELVTGRGTESLPFRTIQAALDNPDFVAGDTVLVKPGDYDDGKYVADSGFPVTNCVHITKKVYLRAADLSPQGRATTCILGKQTPVVDAYCKDGMRCVYVGSNAGGTVIEGFTLRDGMAFYSSKAGAYTGRECCRGGGVFVAGAKKNVYVVDCVISNCLSGIGVAMHGGTAIRCVIENLTSKYLGGVVFSGSYAFACAAKGSTYATTAVPYLMDDDSVAVNCTFVDHSCRGMSNGTYSAYNCLIAGNKSPNVYSDARTNDCFAAAKNADTMTTLGYAGDYRLRSGSGAIGVGRTAHRQVLLDLGVPEQYLVTDLSGRNIDWSAETMNAGAEQTVAAVTTVAVSDPDGELICDAAGETRIVEDRAPWQVTVRANTATNRYPKGFTVNGVEHPFSSYPGCETVSIGLSGMGSQTISIVPMASDWYVNANGGDDALSGFTPETAKLTLADVITNADLRAGDTIYALPGTYAEGKLRSASTATVFTRAVVPAGVTLKATGTPEETIIVGDRSPTPDDATYGTGPDATRCVILRANAALDGFTLTGGRTIKTSASGNSQGGGVYCDATAVVRNCIISNNYAYTGCGGHQGTYVNCRFFGNKPFSGNGSVVYSPTLVEGCVADENDCNNVLMYPVCVCNTTIGYNGNGFSVYNNQIVSNSIIYRVNANTANFYNCLIYTNRSRTTEISAANLAAHGSVGIDSWAKAGLDANFRPRKDSPAVDSGNADSPSKHLPATDADGVPRILNGRIDIGAFEYDWRVDYSKDLGGRVVVTDVSPNVVESEDGKVEVPEGFLKLDWPSKGKPLVFNAQVEGEGTLTVFVNGEEFATLTATDEPQGFRVADPLAENEFEFVFAGSGSATLADFRREGGFLLLVR